MKKIAIILVSLILISSTALAYDFRTDVDVGGTVSADTFYGDGSQLTGVASEGDTTISILDSGSLLGDFSAIDFDTQLSVTANGDTATVESTASGGGDVTAVAADIPGCIQPGGFQLAHNDVNGDSVVTAEVGGVICASTPDGSYYEQVVLGDGDTMDLDADLINGSTRTANQWYELAVIADSDGVEPTKLVAYDSTSTPQSSADLPTDYELFASLSQPRSGWVRTDGSSNLYEQDWSKNGFKWEHYIYEDQSGILNTVESPTSTTQYDVSNYVPPVRVEAKLNDCHGNDFDGIALSNNNDINDNPNYSIGYLADYSTRIRVTSSVPLEVEMEISNQSIFLKTGNSSTLRIGYPNYIEVVGE